MSYELLFNRLIGYLLIRLFVESVIREIRLFVLIREIRVFLSTLRLSAFDFFIREIRAIRAIRVLFSVYYLFVYYLFVYFLISASAVIF